MAAIHLRVPQNNPSKKDQWERVNDSIGRALRNSSIETMVNIISLSYLDLPLNLRTCLLYLSIFPEDHTIDKENLIRRWIGEGFIHKHGDHTLYESGEMCFTELVNRSLIQPVEMDSPFGGHNVKSCRVHDTILDFIVSKAVEENFVTIIDAPGFVNPDPLNKVRRLSLQNNGEIPPDLVVSHARSLHVFGGNVKIPSLPEFLLLRVLDFDNCGQLEDDDLAGTGKLLHLKYLRFRNAYSMTELPEELARLQHLEIGIHSSGKVMKIPEIIQKQLVCYVSVFSNDKLGDEITGIQGLRVLVNVYVNDESIEFLEGLSRLKNLRKLEMQFRQCGRVVTDEYLKEKQEKAVFSIWKLGNASLECLWICIVEYGCGSRSAAPVMEEKWFPCPPCGLRELYITGVSLETVPAWIKWLVKLEILRLPMCEIGEECLEILGALPSLSNLVIHWDSYPDQKMVDKTRRAMEAHPNRPTFVWTYEKYGD